MKKQTQENLKWFAIGIGSLLFVKYILLGLDDWDSILHPNRIEADKQQTQFYKGIIDLQPILKR